MFNRVLIRFSSIIIIGTTLILTACSHIGHQSYYSKPSAIAQAPGENYKVVKDNSIRRVIDESVSTFSVDVDTAAYANIRRFINSGHLPPRDAVRIEEMINYFDYDYQAPNSEDQPFSITTEITPTPWNSGSYLMQVGIKGYEPQQIDFNARNLVFLIDVSGSMNSPNKLSLLKKSLRLLVNQMAAQDRVAIVVYAGASGLALPSTPGFQRNKIISALERLHAGGSTNGGSGLNLAYAVAQQHFIEGGINRVILATDGDFNVGNSSTSGLLQLIKSKKRSGIGLTVLGVGMGDYNDHMLEAISNAGDGNAAYIDSLQEAQKVLVHDINGTLNTIARDTKIQIEFNPNHVSTYRLIGYENRLLNNEDFRNDSVDAGDVGAGHTVTDLYEITLHDELRYQSLKAAQQPYDSEIGFLKIRYKAANGVGSLEIVHAIQKAFIKDSTNKSSENLRFAAAVAAFGQLLRNSPHIGEYSFDQITKLAREGRGNDNNGYRAEFIRLVNLAGSL